MKNVKKVLIKNYRSDLHGECHSRRGECKSRSRNLFKKFAFALIAILFAITLCSCNSKKENSKQKIKIVTTIYPVYDWVKNITQDKCDVELLINSVTDLHSWQPSAKDIVTITGKDTDLFVYVGGDSDYWVNDLMPRIKENNIAIYNIIANNEEIFECEEVCDEHDHHDHEHEIDEHIWLSYKNPSIVIKSLAQKISTIDIDNKDFYLANANNYCNELNSLYEKALSQVTNLPKKQIVIADRNPFCYIAHELDLTLCAAFSGCSAESEASFDVILKLSNFIDKYDLTKIVITETGKSNLAKTVIENCKNKNIEIIVLDSIQSKVSDDNSYIKIMSKNLEVLEKILE